jgi:hypothetical protein
MCAEEKGIGIVVPGVLLLSVWWFREATSGVRTQSSHSGILEVVSAMVVQQRKRIATNRRQCDAVCTTEGSEMQGPCGGMVGLVPIAWLTWPPEPFNKRIVIGACFRHLLLRVSSQESSNMNKSVQMILYGSCAFQ